MKTLMVAAVCALSVGLLTGCNALRDTTGANGLLAEVTEEVAPIEDVTVILTPGGRSLRDAAVLAANRRRWTAQLQGENTVRCTLTQRGHQVVVDVVLKDAKTFSIRKVWSNIPARKYNVWANNLQREIIAQTAR